jgi:hypothetical protein
MRQIRRLVEKHAIEYWKSTDSPQSTVMIDPDVLDQYQENHTVKAQR